MRFRMGLALGFGAGYVLGSKAGRQRYEQIERTTKKIWESPPAEKIRHEIAEKVPEAVSAAAHKVGEMRHRNGDMKIDLDQEAMRAGQLPA
ncbi:MAG: hypothetical protein ACRDKG_14075 [Actinomycetota bacterium]